MSKLFITFCLVIGGFVTVVGQSPTYYIKYDYDAAGNRISRKCLEVTLPQLRSNSVPIDSSSVADELNEIKVTIFPNPTKGVIIVELSDFSPQANLKFSLFSSDGKILKRVVPQSDRTSMDLSSYSSGLYLLYIAAGENKIECKIIKQ